MNRPIEHWLNMLPAGYRERALRAHNSSEYFRRHASVDSMSLAIMRMSQWTCTVEGDNFWRLLHQHYKHRDEPMYTSFVDRPALPTTNKPRRTRA